MCASMAVANFDALAEGVGLAAIGAGGWPVFERKGHFGVAKLAAAVADNGCGVYGNGLDGLHRMAPVLRSSVPRFDRRPRGMIPNGAWRSIVLRGAVSLPPCCERI